MLVSAVIANHDYARYLPEALDSALAQTHPDVEVVVVDDGSTDDSRDVLQTYGDRIVTVLQEQAGQAAALNAGVARARGELVCMLDADDTFTPDKVQRVVAAWRATPAASVISHQMQTVDAAGVPRGRPWPRRIATGDLRRAVARAGGFYPHGLMSALAFPRAYLHRLLPMPGARLVGRGPLGPVEVPFMADTYLAGAAAFIGPVAGVQAPLARYRVHGANESHLPQGGVERARTWNRRMALYDAERSALLGALEQLGVPAPPIRLEDHLEYQLHLRALGRASLPTTLARVLRAPTLPPSMRLREAARVLARRGWSKPIPA